MKDTPYREFGWNTSGPLFYHKIICPQIERLLPEDGSPILDIGCGNGYFANYLLDKGYSVYGIDASQQGIEIANRSHPGHFFTNDVSLTELPHELQNIPFKTVISMEVIEHLYDPREFIFFIKKILNKHNGGFAIITTPYHGYLKNIFIALSGKTDFHFSALWVGGHIKFWSKKTIFTLLREAGFENMKFKGAGRFPYLWKHMIVTAETYPDTTIRTISE